MCKKIVRMDPLRLAEAQGVEFALLGHTVGHSIQFRVFWQCTPQTLTKPIMYSNTEYLDTTGSAADTFKCKGLSSLDGGLKSTDP